VVLSVRAEDLKAELDCEANVKLLDTHFAAFGHSPKQTITREAKGLRIRLPAVTKGVPQTGLYSYFSLVGDFEISMTYDLLAVPPPQKGYGVTCGLGLDAAESGETVNFMRGYQMGKFSGYVVSWGKKDETGKVNYEGNNKQFPSAAKSGRLMLRREGPDIICLASDNTWDAPRELYRLPLTDSTVRPLRVFADSGGSPTPMDVRIGQLKVKAGA